MRTFDKVAGKVFAAGPMALAAERQFYTLPEFSGTNVDPPFLEKQFARVQLLFAEAGACFVAAGFVVLQLRRLPV